MPRAKRYNVTNERAVLAGALLSEVDRPYIMAAVHERDFFSPVHRAIFRALLDCSDVEVIDADLIELHAGEVEEEGFREYVLAILSDSPPANAREHVARLREDRARIDAAAKHRQIAEDLEKREIAFEDIARASKAALAETAKPFTEDTSGVALAEAYMEEVRKRRTVRSAFRPTGFDALDAGLTEGLALGRLVSLLGRPESGKSTTLVELTKRQMKLPIKPRLLVLPLEDGKERFLDKLVCSSTGFTINQLVKHPQELTDEDLALIERKIRKAIATDEHLTVMENPFVRMKHWTDESAMEKTEELMASGLYDMIIIDLYARKLPNSERPEILSKSLVRDQMMCKRYNVTLIAAGHFSRKSEERPGKRPTLEDAKGSGAWEEASDLFLSTYREKAYRPIMRHDILELGVLKQRIGEKFTIEAEFDGARSIVRNERLQDPAARARSERPRNALSDDDGPM